jgi:hypothetical protein
LINDLLPYKRYRNKRMNEDISYSVSFEKAIFKQMMISRATLIMSRQSIKDAGFERTKQTDMTEYVVVARCRIDRKIPFALLYVAVQLNKSCINSVPQPQNFVVTVVGALG